MRSENFTRKFTVTMNCMVSVVFVMPFAVAGYSYVFGEYSHDVWILPYKVV